MPIKLSWLLKGRVIIHDVMGDITMEDFVTIDLPLNKMLGDADPAPVHVIVLTERAGKVPMTITAFTQARWVRHPNPGWTVVSGLKNPMLRTIVGTASRAFRMKQRFVETPTEAMNCLKTIDTSLPTGLSIKT